MIFSLFGCISNEENDVAGEKIEEININLDYETKSSLYSSSIDLKNILRDVCIFVYDDKGNIVNSLYSSKGYISLSLDINKKYSFFVLANMGKISSFPPFETISDIENYIYQCSDQEDLFNIYKNIPMYGESKLLSIPKNRNISIKLTNLSSCIKVILDKSKLDKDVNLDITKVSLHNIPGASNIFQDIDYYEQVNSFSEGSSLNKSNGELASLYNEGVTLYMFENIGNNSYKTYVELNANYYSNSLCKEDIKLLFFLNTDNFSIIRNKEYILHVIPYGRGLDRNTDFRSYIETSDMKFYARDLSIKNGDKILHLNDTCRLCPEIIPVDSNKKVVWSCQPKGIVTLDNNGLVKALKEGQVEITAIVDDSSGVSSSTIINVTKYKFNLGFPDGLSADNIYVGDEFTPWLDQDIESNKVKFSISNPKCAIIDSWGKIKCIARSDSSVIYTAFLGDYSASLAFKIKDAHIDTNISDTVIIPYQELQVNISDIAPYSSRINWSTSSPSLEITSVSLNSKSILVFAHEVGEYKILISAGAHAKKEICVSVIRPTIDIKKHIYMKLNETYYNTAVRTPESAYDVPLLWQVENGYEEYLQINSMGKIMPLKPVKNAVVRAYYPYYDIEAFQTVTISSE